MKDASHMEWWGYSEPHGWVVLDRTLACNVPGITADLLFFRCRDWTSFSETRKKWNPPLYKFAPNYLRGLKGEDVERAATELAAYQAQWPETRSEIQRALRESEEKAEAERRAEERKRKQAEREAKKQLGLQQHS